MSAAWIDEVNAASNGTLGIELSPAEPSDRIDPMTDPLVTADWLYQREGEVDVLDATYYMPADRLRSREDFDAAHIPGARLFEIDEIVDRGGDLPRMLPDTPVFARAMAEFGIDGSRPVVVYDRSANHFSAPRVWFTLRLFRLRGCYVLDGGLNAWTSRGYPTVSGGDEHQPVALREWPRDDRRIVGAKEMAQAVHAAGSPIFDARSAARFAGQAPEPRPGLKSGHMRGARCVPFVTLTRQDGSFADPATLRTLFGHPNSPDPIVTCGSGMTACVLALGLARLGYEARLYDGSWAEWGLGTLGDIVTDAA